MFEYGIIKQLALSKKFKSKMTGYSLHYCFWQLFKGYLNNKNIPPGIRQN